MKKAEFVEAIRRCVASDGLGILDYHLAQFLADYVEKLSIPADQEYDFWRIEESIPAICVGALRAFDEEFGGSTPLSTEVYAGNNLDGSMMIHKLLIIIREVMNDDPAYANHLSSEVDALLSAERNMVMLRFRQFQTKVYYHGGLSKIIADSRSRGMTGQFGETTLRSYVMAGRLMFTFARVTLESTGATEPSISFVCDADDLIGLNGGLQSCYAELPVALAMMEDVIKYWDPEKESQYVDDAKVTMG